MSKKKWNIIEVSLLVMLAVCLVMGAYSLQKQDALAQKMIRLHILANSDSGDDQLLKMQVQQQVSAYTEQTLRSSADLQEAQTRLQSDLPVIQALAEETLRENGCGDTVAVALEEAEFPEKAYDGFALPAGQYTALRVVIGAGEGHNWWCVVYPPLCTAAATDLEETAISCGMEQEDISFMEQDSQGYTLKFRSVELWEQLRQRLGK